MNIGNIWNESEMRGGKLTLTPRKPYLNYSQSLRIIRAPMDGSGGAELLYEHPAAAQSAHCAFCPTDDTLLYFDLDLPPSYWCGSDGHTPRIWLLDINDGKVRPLKTDYPGQFQTHQAWVWDGLGICYHGPASGGGEFFGVADIEGRTLWEEVFPEARAYGHNTPDARKQALIIDGTFSKDLLQWLYWGEQSCGNPRLEPICVHGTEWNSLPGQYSHPHPLTDPAGRFISFTAAHGGRSDIYAVQI